MQRVKTDNSVLRKRSLVPQNPPSRLRTDAPSTKKRFSCNNINNLHSIRFISSSIPHSSNDSISSETSLPSSESTLPGQDKPTKTRRRTHRSRNTEMPPLSLYDIPVPAPLPPFKKRLTQFSAASSFILDSPSSGRISFYYNDKTMYTTLSSLLYPYIDNTHSNILLYGDLGCGKTTFAQSMIRHITQSPLLVIPSPSFTLNVTYTYNKYNIYHMDLYRLTHRYDTIGLDVPTYVQITNTAKPYKPNHTNTATNNNDTLTPPSALVESNNESTDQPTVQVERASSSMLDNHIVNIIEWPHILHSDPKYMPQSYIRLFFETLSDPKINLEPSPSESKTKLKSNPLYNLSSNNKHDNIPPEPIFINTAPIYRRCTIDFVGPQYHENIQYIIDNISKGLQIHSTTNITTTNNANISSDHDDTFPPLELKASAPLLGQHIKLGKNNDYFIPSPSEKH